MEASDCAYGSFQRAGTVQFGQEKKGAGGDHFAVDDLLDFSNEEEEEEEDDNVAGAEDTATGISSAGSSTANALDSCNSCYAADDIRLSGDLCEPYDDLAELEWLSNFVEESFSSEDVQKLQLLSGIKSAPGSGSGSSVSINRGGSGTLTTITTAPAPAAPLTIPEASAVPGKARSKRSRGVACSWSSRLLVLSPTPSLDSGPILLDPSPRRKAPKPARKAEAAPDGRKCLHCATDRTPQWRTGPMGPKTLCNACGVRYKSGRLVPEYRPAASPTFTMSKHSNSHRKVLELRRQKEMMQAQVQQLMMAGPTSGPDEFLIHHRIGPGFPSDS